MKHVLCIDDDVVAQRLYSILLKNAGYEVVTATSASLAIERIEERSYVATILDYMMPDLGGLDIAARIRRHSTEAIRNLPIVVCSASLDRKAVQQFTAMGVRHFLVKPIEKELLKQTLLRAAGSEWNGRAITSLELICSNLGVDGDTALELLQHASEQLEKQYGQLLNATRLFEESAVKTHCSCLRSTLGNLGLRSDDEWMMEARGLVTAVEVGAGDPQCEEQLKRLEATLGRLRQDVTQLRTPSTPQDAPSPA